MAEVIIMSDERPVAVAGFFGGNSVILWFIILFLLLFWCRRPLLEAGC